MEKVGKCYSCKYTIYLNSTGQWVTRDGALRCVRGSYKNDKRGHRMKMPNSGPFTMVASNWRNEKEEKK